jgi:hypothetical protein
VKASRCGRVSQDWRRITLLIVTLGLFAGLPPPVPANANPPSLSGEVLTGTLPPSSSCPSTDLAYSLSGTASGPYPGTFTESGTGSWNSTSTKWTFTVKFTINSAVGKVTGTKTYSSGGAAGSCTPVGSGVYREFFELIYSPGLTYTAQIQTSSGTFTDQGVSRGELCATSVCRQNWGEWELTAGQFREDYGPDISPPEVRGPFHSFRATDGIFVGKPLGATSIPVRLNWPTLDTSGISKYELQESIDGGTFTDVALPAPATRAKIVYLEPGAARYRFRLRATDGLGNVSAWATTRGFMVNAFQESDPAIDYTGNSWLTSALSTAYGGSVRHCGNFSCTATFSVPAGTTDIAWVSPKARARGEAQVYLDGTLVGRLVDLYSATRKNRAIVFRLHYVSPLITHLLKIQVLGVRNPASIGTRVDVDALVTIQH